MLHGAYLPTRDPSSVPFRLNMGLGSEWAWLDLDKPGPLAYALAFTGAASASEIVGPRTSYPIAMGIGKIMRMAYRVKAFQVSTSITGESGPIANTNTALTSVSGASAFPSSAPRAYLIKASYEHRSTGVYVGDSIAFLANPTVGFRYLSQYYPSITATVETVFAASPNSVISTFADPADNEVGSISFMGSTAPLYERGVPTAPNTGNITVTEQTLWT